MARIRQIIVPSSFSTSPTLLVPLGVWQEIDFELPQIGPGMGGEARLRVGTAAPVSFALATASQTEEMKLFGLLGLFQGSFQGVNARVRFDDVRIDYLE